MPLSLWNRVSQDTLDQMTFFPHCFNLNDNFQTFFPQLVSQTIGFLLVFGLNPLSSHDIGFPSDNILMDQHNPVQGLIMLWTVRNPVPVISSLSFVVFFCLMQALLKQWPFSFGPGSLFELNDIYLTSFLPNFGWLFGIFWVTLMLEETPVTKAKLLGKNKGSLLTAPSSSLKKKVQICF